MKKDGMALVTMAVMLVIIILITGTVVISGLSSIESAKKTSFGIEIKKVQEIVNEYVTNTGEQVPITKTLVLSTSAILAADITNQFTGETITANAITLDVIDIYKLGIKDTKYGRGENALDYYAVSPTTGKVFYPAGIKAADQTYYTLTSDLNKIIGKNDTAGTVKRSVIFKASKASNAWQSSAVVITVKVPNEYTAVSITTTNSVLVSAVTVIGDYKVYTVNTSNLIIAYTITVNYMDVVTSKSAVYKVGKVDGVAPSIATPSQVYSIDNTTNIATAYMTGIDATDALSGLKTVKYVKGTVTASVDLKSFFGEHGMLLVDNKIQIEKGATSYSIYAEDNAGNITVINTTVTAYIQSILW